MAHRRVETAQRSYAALISITWDQKSVPVCSKIMRAYLVYRKAMSQLTDSRFSPATLFLSFWNEKALY